MNKRGLLGRLLKDESVTRKFGIVCCLLLLSVVFSFLSSKFATGSNWMNILQQAAINGCIAVGMTLVVITGGIDLSVGSVMALSAMIMAMLMKAGVSPVAALAIGILVGAGGGALNGVLIAQLNLQPFLVTMGMMSLYRGLTLIISDGLPVRRFSSSFVNFMASLNMSFPIPIIVLLLFATVIFIVMRYSLYGQHVFAIGGNEEATRLSGINTKAVKIATYALSGFAACLAGIIYLGRLAAADPQAGASYEMNGIAAAAIGG
ncbi:MAG: ABC transporter permease, partial [Planctomycetota bacterium]|nr:ABC transporter permease [Planctomycetota bacterium]